MNRAIGCKACVCTIFFWEIVAQVWFRLFEKLRAVEKSLCTGQVEEGVDMFKNKNNLSNNICGENVRRLRYQSAPYLSQRMFAERLCQEGIEMDKNAIQRIESGRRFVTDIELTAIARAFGVTLEELIQQEGQQE